MLFDVVGTLVGYERLFNAIDVRLGERLRAERGETLTSGPDVDRIC